VCVGWSLPAARRAPALSSAVSRDSGVFNTAAASSAYICIVYIYIWHNDKDILYININE